MVWELIPPAEWIADEVQLAETMNYFYNVGMSGEPIAFDTETSGLDIAKDRPVLGSMSDGRRRVAFWAEYLRHPWIAQAILGNPSITICGTKLKFDKHMSHNYGVEIAGDLEDTLVQDWLYDENRFGRHGLKETMWDYLGIQTASFSETFGKAQKGEGTEQLIRRAMADPAGFKKAVEYSGLDAYGSRRVRDYLKGELSRIVCRSDGYDLWRLYEQWEKPFTQILWDMERRGFTIYTGHLRSQLDPMAADLYDLEMRLAQLAGWAVNLQSPKQLQKLFFEQLKASPIKWTDTKQPSTDEEVLKHWSDTKDPILAPFADIMLQHRGIAKIKGTYIEGLLSWVDQFLRIHTTLNQHITVTGRLSSSDPNLQNIPKPETDIYKVRDAFVASEGRQLVVADYDQLEMKIMAHMSGDQNMIQAILTGKDLHCFTVSMMFGEDYDEVEQAKKAKDNHEKLTPRQKDLVIKRSQGKSTGFGLIYGIGEAKLGTQLNLKIVNVKGRDGKDRPTCPEAKSLINRYLNHVYPGVGQFMEQTTAECKRDQYVQTILGRFRRLPGINAGRGEGTNGIAAEARRQAVNTRIQGTAADITKAAMIRVANDPIMRSLGAVMILQIHDEIIMECDDHPEIVRETKKRLRELMQDPFNGYQLSVPLTAGCGSGYSWVEAK